MATRNSTDTSKPLGATQGGLGTATYATGDIPYASASNTISKLTIGSTGNALTLAAGVPSWAPRIGGTPTTGQLAICDSTGAWVACRNDKYLYFFDDFIYRETNTPTYWPWLGNWSSGNTNIITSEAGHPGIVESTTSSSSSSTADLQGSSLYVTGDYIKYETVVRFPNLADGTQDYRARMGLVSAIASPVSGVYFEYDRANSTNWRGCCTASSTTTRTTGTDVAVASNTWTRLTFVLNSAGSSVEFFVGSTSIGTVTANIPATAVSIRFGIQKTAGTTARTIQTDYVKIYSEFGSDRY